MLEQNINYDMRGSDINDDITTMMSMASIGTTTNMTTTGHQQQQQQQFHLQQQQPEQDTSVIDSLSIEMDEWAQSFDMAVSDFSNETMIQATLLVQNIVEQITLHDSPAQNEYNTYKQLSNNNNSVAVQDEQQQSLQQQRSRQQQHFPQPPKNPQSYQPLLTPDGGAGAPGKDGEIQFHRDRTLTDDSNSTASQKQQKQQQKQRPSNWMNTGNRRMNASKLTKVLSSGSSLEDGVGGENSSIATDHSEFTSTTGPHLLSSGAGVMDHHQQQQQQKYLPSKMMTTTTTTSTTKHTTLPTLLMSHNNNNKSGGGGIEIPENLATLKLGTSAYSSLCNWTLQQLNNNNSNSNHQHKNNEVLLRNNEKSKNEIHVDENRMATDSFPSHGLQVNTTEEVHAASASPLPSAVESTHFRTQFELNYKKNHQQRKGKRKLLRWSNNDTKLLPSAITNTLTGTPKLMSNSSHHNSPFTGGAKMDSHTEEEKKEDGNLHQPSTPAVRLQLFGSEYARHLSTCQLAPTAASLLTQSGGGGHSSGGVQPRCTVNGIRSCLQQNNKQSPLIRCIEDAPREIRNGALLDIVVTENDQPPPLGYYRISQTLSGRPFMLSASSCTPLYNCGSSNNNSSSGSSSSILLGGGSMRTSSGSVYYLNVKKEPLWDKAAQRPCITALTIIYPDRQEFVPPGMCVVRTLIPSATSSKHHDGIPTGKNNNSSTHRRDKNTLSGGGIPTSTQMIEGPPANLNRGYSGSHNSSNRSCTGSNNGNLNSDRVYLCFRRSREGNPITGIIPLSPAAQEIIPVGYTVIERTPRNYVACLMSCGEQTLMHHQQQSMKSSSSQQHPPSHIANNAPTIFIAYRQRLANLETLRPLPLLMSVQEKKDSHGAESSSSSYSLNSYYCTGGTIVQPVEVGRFHIMDRSTHSLLSPSSVANRMHLITSSRRKAMQTDSDISTSDANHNETQQQQENHHHYQRSSSSQSSHINDFDSSTAAERGTNRKPYKTTTTSDCSSSVNQVDDLSFNEGLSHVSYGVERNRDRNGSVDTNVARSRTLTTDSGTTSLHANSNHGGYCLADDITAASSTDGAVSTAASSSGLSMSQHYHHHHHLLMCTSSSQDDGDDCSGGGGIEATYMSLDDKDYHTIENQKRLYTLSFIPIIETARTGDDVIARLTVRMLLMTPLLTACYIRHGGAALIAVEGLTTLLTTTDFFHDDVNLSDECDNNESSRRLTLLDLAVQAVCDVATCGSQVITFASCVHFVERAISFAQGQLSTRTIGFAVRFYLFVFYFDACIPRSSTSSTKAINQNKNKAGNNQNHYPTRCPDPSWRPLTMYDEEDFPMLYDVRIEDVDDNNNNNNSNERSRRAYLPGGAPQTAALALKDLISFSIVRLGKVSVTDLFVLRNNNDLNNNCTTSNGASVTNGCQNPAYTSLFDSILSSLVDDAVDHVDRANYTQLALHQIHRSGGSELFWHDMIHECGQGLFGNDPTLREPGRDIFIMMFAVVQQLIKVASGKLRITTNSSLSSPNNNSSSSSSKNKNRDVGGIVSYKDIASKLLSLELLLHFLEFWSDEQEAVTSMSLSPSRTNSNLNNNADGTMPSIHTLSFVVRRTVIPCLLWNTQAAIDNPQVFRRVITIISELWGSPVYRRHCKVELGMIIEHFGLRIIELGPQIPSNVYKNNNNKTRKPGNSDSLLSQQVELISEIKTWFSNDPNDVVEMFLNYDTDLSCQTNNPTQLLPGTRWQLFQRICAGLCHVAEKCGDSIAYQIKVNQSLMFSNSSNQIHNQSASTTNLKGGSNGQPPQISRDEAKQDASLERESTRLLRKISIEAISQIVKSIALSAATASGSQYSSLIFSFTTNADDGTVDPLTGQPALPHLISSVSNDDEDMENDDAKAASRHDIPIAKKASADDDEVLKFWQNAISADQHQRGLCMFPSTQESLATAFELARTKNLKKGIEYLIACNTLMSSPRDIANFLQIHKNQFDPTELGLYLSEGGVNASETEYWNSIRYHFIRAISFVGMTVDEGLRHFLTMSGFKLPGEAQRIDRMVNTFALIYFEENAGDITRCPFQDHDTIYLVVFAMIMLNTDLHKTAECSIRKPPKKMTKIEFINNLRGAVVGQPGGNSTITKEYLSRIYDSIEVYPIAMANEDVISNKASEKTQKQLIREMLSNVRSTDSLLRGLAIHDFKFATIEDFTASNHHQRPNSIDNLSDLTRTCVSKTWHHWYGVVNTCLETAHLDPQGMEPAVEILLYALCATICLNMPVERTAFLNQLVRLKAFEENRQGRWVSAPSSNHRAEKWFMELEEACAGTSSKKIQAITTIFNWMQSLRTALRGDVTNKVGTALAVAEIINGGFLLHDPSRSFVRCGDLLKKSSRTGKVTEYRFYLFSDVMLYASKQGSQQNNGGTQGKEGGRYKIHEELPLHLMKIVDWFPPAALSTTTTGHNTKNQPLNAMFEVHHPRKRFQVLCSSMEERKSWVEDIRNAIVREMERQMNIEASRLMVYHNASNASNSASRRFSNMTETSI